MYLNKQQREKYFIFKNGFNHGILQDYLQVRICKVLGKKDFFILLDLNKYKRNRSGFFINSGYTLSIHERIPELIKIYNSLTLLDFDDLIVEFHRLEKYYNKLHKVLKNIGR